MEKKYLSEDIWYIENFYDESKLDQILEELNSIEIWDGHIDSVEEYSVFYNNLLIKDNLKSVRELYEIQISVESLFPEYIVNPADITRYQARIVPGNENWALPLHKDVLGNENIAYGVVFYFNDNYKGGEILYPDLDISFAPKRNTLLCHKSDLLHGVNRVTEGNRYCFPMFVYNKL